MMLCLILILFLDCLYAAPALSVLGLDRHPMAISILNKQSHEYVLSNRLKSHWTSDTSKTETRKWQGFGNGGYISLINFWLDTDQNVETAPQDIISNTILPFAVTNYFTHCNETVWMVKDKDVLVFRYDVVHSGNFYFRPVVGMRKDWDTTVQDFDLSWTGNPKDELILHISTRNPQYKGARYLSCGTLSADSKFIKSESFPKRKYERDIYRNDGDPNADRFVYQPGKISIQAKVSVPLYVACALGSSSSDNENTLRNILRKEDNTMNEMKDSINAKLSNVSISTDSTTLDKSLNWALASVDSLTMNVAGRGIYAGLHWFTQYWGRDSFISLQGALLVSGDFDLARQFITTMALSQDINYNSKTYGRVPNILQQNDQTNNYETTDGTAFWVRGIWQLFEYSGIDIPFLNKIWVSIECALDGEFRRMDSYGFLTHGDRETWMDAAVNGIPVTKRGNRAVEIQALFFTELDIAYRLATVLDKKPLAAKYFNAMNLLKSNFLKVFWNSRDQDLFDHINADGIGNSQKRPNSVFVISVPLKDNPLLPFEKSQLVMNSIMKAELIADHGVRTLSPHDLEYRKTHDETGVHHDYSYHQGDVWPWLSGHVIDAALYVGDVDLASHLLQIYMLRALTVDTIGSIEEILDGTLPPSATPYLGTSRGAMTQAWSVAEFIRAVHQCFFGIRPGFSSDRTLELTFNLPSFLSRVSVNTPLGEGKGTVLYSVEESILSITLIYESMREDFDINIIIPKLLGTVKNVFVDGKEHSHLQADIGLTNIRVNVSSTQQNSVKVNIKI